MPKSWWSPEVVFLVDGDTAFAYTDEIIATLLGNGKTRFTAKCKQYLDQPVQLEKKVRGNRISTDNEDKQLAKAYFDTEKAHFHPHRDKRQWYKYQDNLMFGWWIRYCRKELQPKHSQKGKT